MKGRDATPAGSEQGQVVDVQAELERLRGEITQLREREQRTVLYVRAKVDQLLDVIGTLPLRQEELDDDTLLQTDPIGIVAESFRLVLSHLHATNDKLVLANHEVREIVDAAGAGIMVVDRDGGIVTMNTRATELFGAVGGIPVGMRCRDIVCQAGGRPPICALEEVVDAGAAELRTEWDQGNRCFEVVARPIHDEGGVVSHVVIVYSDVSDRKRTEEALRRALEEAREARAQVEGILHSVADGLLVTDCEQRIVLMNPTAEQLLGVSGLDAPVPLSAAIRDAGLQQTLGTVLDCGSADRIDFVLPGMERLFEGRISLLRHADGAPRGNIVIIRDVTQERQIERMKSDFVATAAHEFRTPLAAILGFTELLLEPDKRNKAQRNEFLHLIHEKAEALARMVNNLLDISRIESGEELPLSRSQHPLTELVGHVLPLFERYAARHTFEVQLPEQPVLLDVDADTVEQVFENIIGNAVKYSPLGGMIRITARIEDGFCRIAIADQGIGMSPQEAARVFDKFYRVDSSNTAVRGTGLGMTIVQHIIETHGGRIWIESSKGCGTTVYFTLPLAVGSED